MAQSDLHPEVRNLAIGMNDDTLSEIGKKVCETWKYDRSSRSEWEAMHAEWLNLYYQKDKPKNPPWEGSSQESLPLLAEGCTQFSARAYKAMFPSQQIIRAVPTGVADSDDKSRAERVGKHMSWQLMVQDRNYRRNKDRLLLSLPLHGSFFTKTYHDPVKGRNVVANVRATDLVVPYGTGPRDIEDIERKTEMIWMPRHRGAMLAKEDYFTHAPVPYKRGEVKQDDRAHDDAEGVRESAQDPHPPSLLLEQHCFLDIKDNGDYDPYIVTVDAESEKVLRISIRWETNAAGEDIDDRRPIEFYTHYTYMENPDGFYGLGLGHLISQPNISVNKMLRQTVDASTLANAGNHSGFVSEQLGGIQGGEIEMQLGKFKKIPGSVEDIRNGIFQFQFPGPNQTLPALIDVIMARSDRLATVTEAMTGQTDKVMQPTTVMALIEQGLQVFTTVYERISESWTRELEKIYRLNFKFLDEEEYFAILDADGMLRQYVSGQTDYTDDLQIRPLADPRLSTEQQRMAKAEVTYQLMMSNPLVQNSPQHMYTNTKRMLETIGVENTEELLPNPAQANLPRVDDPVQENSFALQQSPQMPLAFPDQDHMGHIKAHAELLREHSGLSDFGRHLVEEHIRAHGRLSTGPTSSQGMAAGADDAGGITSLGSALPGDGLEGAGGEILDGGGVPGDLDIAGALGGLGLPQEPTGEG